MHALLQPLTLALRPAFRRVHAWALCLGAALVVAQGHAQESDHGAAWVSSAEHQRVILPRLSKQPAAATRPAARGVSESAGPVDAMPDATVQRATTTDRAAAVAEQLLQRPSRAALANRASERRHQMTPEMAQMLQRASHHFAVDAHLVQAVIHAESAFNPHAVSPKNAIGLMQVLPSTARDLGLQDLQGLSVEQLLADPRVSIVLGTKYLAEQLARFGGDVELAVAAYNAGPGAVIKAGHRVPNYPETRHYVRRVLSLAQTYRRQGSRQGSLGAPA